MENDKGHRALIIDDDEAILNILPYYLAAKGIDSTTACDPMDAIEYFEDSRFDVLIIDIKMPYMDGISLGRKLSGHCPVILISGNFKADNTVLKNCDAYISKSHMRERIAETTINAIKDYQKKVA
ncbi:MAG: response regulator [Bacteriovoracaceae bacterium]|nr:response regulator [Bacteriovoracaceae bacterium]